MRSEAEIRRGLDLARRMSRSSDMAAATMARMVVMTLSWTLAEPSELTTVMEATERKQREIESGEERIKRAQRQ